MAPTEKTEFDEVADLEVHEPHDPFAFNILDIVKTQQSQNGLRHNDHHRYRQYCTRRLRRIRSSLHHTHSSGNRGKYKANPLPEDFDDMKFLTLPLVQAERAWAYATQLKLDNANLSQPNSRWRLHSVARYTKAAKWSVVLRQMAEKHCDHRSIMEAEAYEAFMHGAMFVEKELWREGADSLSKCMQLYDNLAVASLDNQAMYRAKIAELEQPIRLCKYKLGERVDTKKTPLSVGSTGNHKYRETSFKEPEEAQAREAFRQLIFRMEQKDTVDPAVRYGEIGVLCTEALKAVHNEMIRTSSPELRVVESYLREVQFCNNIERNIGALQTLLERLQTVFDLSSGEVRKNTRPEDGIRICDLIKEEIANLMDLPDSDLEIFAAFQAIIQNARCLMLALCYILANESLKAAAMLNMLEGRVEVVLPSKKPASMAAVHGGMAALQALLPDLVAIWGVRVMTILVDQAKPGIMADVNMNHFPPVVESIMAKPFLLDLAFNCIEAPDLSSLKSSRTKAALGRMAGLSWGGLFGRK